jgi:hypothetical protein
MNQGVRLFLLGLLIWPLDISAIEGLKISAHCPDIVISWPSKAGETYIVQYRATQYE